MKAMRKRGGVTILSLVLLLALLSVGVSYGLWSKTLFIEGTVNTGRVHAKWSNASSSDRTGALDMNLDPNGNVIEVPKDVGRLICEINTEDPQILDFTVINGYPSYYADCEGEWTNDGTIPVKIVALRAGPAGGPIVDIPHDTWVDMDLNGDGANDINLQVVNGLCTQVHPGETEAYSIKIHVKQAAPQNAELKFVVEVQLNQWNEAPICGPE